jgi:toxin ParE1/3/4
VTKRIVRRDVARADIIEISAYIGADNPDAAERFLDAIDDAIDRHIALNPNSGVKRDYGRETLSGLRMIAVPGFPQYLVFYRVDEDAIRIVRILHGARDIPNVLDPGD